MVQSASSDGEITNQLITGWCHPIDDVLIKSHSDLYLVQEFPMLKNRTPLGWASGWASTCWDLPTTAAAQPLGTERPRHAMKLHPSYTISAGYTHSISLIELISKWIMCATFSHSFHPQICQNAFTMAMKCKPFMQQPASKRAVQVSHCTSPR